MQAEIWRGGLLADGTNPPRPVTLVLDRGLVASVAELGEPLAAPSGALVRELDGLTITPGLIDCHTHLFLSSDTSVPGAYERELLHDPIPLRTLRAAANARALLESGFTTIRDVCTEGAGFADVALAQAVDDGVCAGPRIVPSGPGLGATGGYLPGRFAEHVCVPQGCRVVDGVDACRAEVRHQLAQGARWIKVFADWPTGPIVGGRAEVRPTFSDDELRVVCEEAARRGRRVAAHVTSDAGARQAIACGVASLEHLGPLAGDTLALAAERRVYLVPTLSVQAYRRDSPDERVRDHARARFDAAAAAFERARAAGVTIVCGSDIGAYPHAAGSLSELRLMIELGMSPLEALGAATRQAAALLERPELGAVVGGAVADLCVWQDLSFTTPPVSVVQGGRTVR